jgi:hypothetical protein
MPLLFFGMPKKSANDAPIGRVRTYATQNVSTGLAPSRHATSGTQISAVNTIADPRYPRWKLCASRSPSAVPMANVKMTASQ